MNYLLIWLLIGSLGANLLWALDYYEEVKGTLEPPNRPPNGFEGFYLGIPHGLLLGPFMIMFFIYRLIVVLRNKK